MLQSTFSACRASWISKSHSNQTQQTETYTITVSVVVVVDDVDDDDYNNDKEKTGINNLNNDDENDDIKDSHYRAHWSVSQRLYKNRRFGSVSVKKQHNYNTFLQVYVRLVRKQSVIKLF